MDISEQFYGKTQLASWITKNYSNAAIKNLIDKIPQEEAHKALYPHFWTIGPKENKSGIWLYGQSDDKEYYNFNREIISISLSVVDPNTIIVLDYEKVAYVLRKRCSASSLARTLDYFLRGDYCDIPPIHMDDLYEMLNELKEG